MSLEMIQTLYRYNAWANQRVLDTAARLSPDQLQATMGASFDSVHATLVHVMGAQWMWLSRWQGTSPTAALNPVDYPDLAAMRQRWDEIERDTQAFVKALDEAGLARVVNYSNTRGDPFAYPLWQLMLHQVNHATQHRSEVAMVMTRLGYSPDWLDLIGYLHQV